MDQALTPPARGRWLLMVAAPAEARAVLLARGGRVDAADAQWVLHELDETLDLAVSGVGKSNAAGAAARLLDPRRHTAIVSIGVAGALPVYEPADDRAGGPARAALPIGASIAASRCVYADEGVRTPAGFIDLPSLGFPLGPFDGCEIPADAAVLARLSAIADRTGPIATVSACSGTDAAALDVAARTGAIAEAMEGAAVAHVAGRLGVPAGELRVISNTTGDRARQVWRLAEALDALRLLIGRL